MMRRRDLLLGLPLGLSALTTACSRKKSTAPEARRPFAPDPPPDEERLPDLVFWKTLSFYDQEIPAEAGRLFNGIESDPQPRYLPYLFDLVSLPNPFWKRSVDILEKVLGPQGDLGPFSWFEDRGFVKPEADTPSYLAFKQRVYAVIQKEIAAFMDPAQPRTISAQEVLWGGVPVDGIPPLESPKLQSVAEATWMGESDRVIGIEINGVARAYPRRIIDWHEMVNDTVGGFPVSLAYCTLCGSAILYDGRLGERVFRFGTSGLLYRSNKLMYDRQTRTLWEQYTGEPAWGPLVGQGFQLKTLPAVHTTWREWKAAHPETTVLDVNTGFLRDYTEGEAYRDYFGNSELIFPAPDRRGPLKAKDVVVVVRVGGDLLAVSLDLLKREGMVEERVGGVNIVVCITPDETGGRAFDRGARSFVRFERKSSMLFDNDGAVWRVADDAAHGPGGATLPRLAGHNSFWFAVTNHAPGTRLVS